ncbi:MAG: PTS sugar transporter subunit IIA [bacterium]
MIGVIIVTHGDLGSHLVKTSEAIIGPQEKVKAISLFPEEGIDALREKITKALDELSAAKGVVIFTDMIGGTPTNTSLSLAHREDIEIITGVNLPMLLACFASREVISLVELSDKLCQTGHKSIVNAKQIFLKKLKDSKNK